MLRATVRPPGLAPLLVYCAHLEVFCGVLARLAHLADVFDDARTQMGKVCTWGRGRGSGCESGSLSGWSSMAGLLHEQARATPLARDAGVRRWRGAHGPGLPTLHSLPPDVHTLPALFCNARANPPHHRQGFDRIAILGDMNTMAHGIARVSPSYCCDALRFRCVGRGAAW